MQRTRYTGGMFSKLSLVFGGLAALIVGAISLQAQLSLPNEITQPAQAMQGGGCQTHANVCAGGGGGVSLGEVPIPNPKGCPAISCWCQADGSTKCLPKPAAQGMAGGGGGLMDSIGQMLQKMLGGGGGGGGDSGGGYQAPIDYEYGQKPVCTNFVSSSGTQPTQQGSSLLLTWTRTGGQTESVTITPNVGVATVQSPVEFKAPSKSTTYTLTVANRSGSSTCTTRVFVGPPGSAITDPEDVAFLATLRQVDGAATTTGEQNAELTNPLGTKNKSYSDLAHEDAASGATSAPDASREGTTATQVRTPADTHITAQGVVEAGVVDANAFEVDPNAFVEENAFFGDTTTDVQIHGRGDIDALEARMRALMQAKMARGTGSPMTTTSGTLPVDITGSLGMQYDALTGDTPVEQQGIFSRVGMWFKSAFCFWCVAPRMQGGAAILLADTVGSSGTNSSDIVPAGLPGQFALPTLERQNAALAAAKVLPDTLTPECKARDDEARQKECGVDGISSAQSTACRKNYELKKKLLPVETADKKDMSSPIGTTLLENDSCQQKQEIQKKYGAKCGECVKGVIVVPKKLTTETGKGELNVCLPEKDGKVIACREKKETKTPPGGSQTSGGNTNGNTSNNPGAQNGGGNPPGGGGGMSGDLMKGLGEMLGKMLGGMGGGSGSGGGQPPQDPCALANAMYNPACNPTLPTEPPSCAAGGAADQALTTSSSLIYAGQTATLSWGVTGKGKITTVVFYKTTDETGREMTGSLGAVDGGTGTKDVSPDRSTSYTLKATNEIGSVMCAPVRVSVRPKTATDDVATDDPLSARQLQVTCEPSSYAPSSGEQPTVSWDMCPTGTTSTFGTSTEDGAFSTGGLVSGSADVSPQRDATYVVRCRNAYNEELSRSSCRIDVTGDTQKPIETTSKTKPSVEIFVDNGNDVVAYGESVRVEWRSKNAASCVIYGPGCKRFGRSSTKCFKEIGRSGYVVGNIYETSDFVAECRGADRKSLATDEVVITVGSDASAVSSDVQAETSAEQVIPTTYDETSLDALLQGE